MASPGKQQQVKVLLAEYLEFDIETSKLQKPLTAAEETEILNQRNSTVAELKDRLFLPANVDFERQFFNFENPMRALDPETIIIKYHNLDVRVQEQWAELVDRNRDAVAALVEQSGFHDDSSYQITNNPDDIIEQVKKGGWDTFNRNLDVATRYQIFDYSTLQLNRQVNDYNSEWRLFGNNCSCAAARSMDVLYETNEFARSTDVIVTPAKVHERALAFSERKFQELKAQDLPVAQTSSKNAAISAAASALAVTALLMAKEYAGLGLTPAAAGKNNACFSQEQSRFYGESKPIFDRIDADFFYEDLLRYFSSIKKA